MADWKNVHLAEQDEEIAALRAKVEKLERVREAAKEYVKLHDNPDSNDTEAWLCAVMEVGQELDAALAECEEARN